MKKQQKNARQTGPETQLSSASATPAGVDMKPIEGLPGSPSENARQCNIETQFWHASATPAKAALKPTERVPGSPLSTTIEAIRAHHRERRFAMGIQQVLDRKLESFIRINKTDWHVGDDEAMRDKANKDVAAKIKAARQGEGDPSIIKVVQMTDAARAPADAERARHEKEMETLARSLPVAPWVATVPGLGYLGLATIIAETGDLSLYANAAKVWKRLGYAPYNGLAGSSWKRPSWRNGQPALSADEWTEHPFSGKRYALIHVISIWLLNKQWIGAGKTEDGIGKPNGVYGEIYAKRQAHTAVTHPEWTKMHARMDALRVMMKEVLKDLWLEWNSVGRHTMRETHSNPAITETPATAEVKPIAPLPGSPIHETVATKGLKPKPPMRPSTPAKRLLKPNIPVPGSPIHETVARTQLKPSDSVRPSTPASGVLKPNEHMPGSPIHETVANNRLSTSDHRKIEWPSTPTR